MPSSVNKRGLVPKLRFPEFRDAGEWKNKPLAAELALMDDLIPLLKKLAQGREISGLGAYEQ
jgi:hypothetical protein